MSLEDHIHQAFSMLIEARQNGRDIKFEEQNFPASRGPLSDHGVFDLSGSCGILGFSHPVMIKAHLYLAIRGYQGTTLERSQELLREINGFLSQIVGVDVSIKDSNLSGSYWVGRTRDFFSIDELNALNSGKEVSLKSLFGERFSVVKGKSEYVKPEPKEGFLNFSSLYLMKEISKFLALGQFYGENGLINRRTELISSKFSGLNFVSSIDGLVVKLNKPLISKRILSGKNELIFPLSFNEDNLNEIIKVLKDDGCI